VNKIKLVVIDDEVDFCYFLKQNLEREGRFDVTTCSDSTRALGIIQEERPQLVLLDIIMPGVDGFTLLRQIRASEKTWHVPVIMLTAKGDSESIFEGKKYRATDYIIKPFEIKELLKFIQHYLNLESPERSEHPKR
jgi:DNA-binding response OmpR family regulator